MSVQRPTSSVAAYGGIFRTAPRSRLLMVATIAALVASLLPGSPSASAGSATAAVEGILGATSTETSTSALALAWYDNAWQYRRAVQISHPGSGDTVSEYQVRIELDGSFDFAHAATDGLDVRMTADDGTTLIPFWIETWAPSGLTASIWVKVPSIPVGGTTVYLYYGNSAATTPPTPTPVPVPPIGPFTKNPGNPLPVTGAPCGGTTPQLLPEDMVASEGKYYLLVSDRSCGSLGLLSADSPSGPWTYAKQIFRSADLPGGEPRTQLDSPHLLQVGSDWYLFYSHYYPWGWNETYPAVIGLAKSTTGILGSYAQINSAVLSTGLTGTWDDARVAEPYVLQKPSGDWVIVYMGDADPNGGWTEQVGIATSSTGVEGPYVKSLSNPVIPFGPAGSLDAGTVADPWVVGFNGTYYVGYTASPAKAGWNTTYATTTDWVTFTKSNTVILGQGPGSYDSVSAFRGAVSLFADTYYFPYTSQNGGFRFSMATQPATAAPPNIVNNPDAVFKFYDGFSGSTVDTSKWRLATRGTAGGTATVSGGFLTLTAPAIGGLNIQELVGTSAFGPGGVMLEALARHVTATGDGKTAGEVALGVESFDPSLRIVDYNSPFFLTNVTNVTGGETWPAMARPLDSTNYLLHRIAWAQPGSVAFSLANDSPVTIATNIPTRALPPLFASVAIGRATTVSADWVRVRSWVGAEAGTVVGAEEALSPVNDPPVAVDDDASGTEDTLLTITKASLIANDSNGGDGGTLSLTAVSDASGGSVVIDGSDVKFTPTDNLCGLDVASFDYTVSDTIDTDTGTVTIDLTCVNDPPVAVDDDASGTEDTLLTITKASLIANDSNGGDGGTLSLTAVSDASGGSVVIDGSDVKFTPTDNLCGLDVASFDYTVSDTIDTDTGTVTIDLTCVNDPPVAVDDDASGTEDTLLTIAKASLIANDSNGGDGGTLSLTAVSDASGGSVVIDGSDVKFTPTDNLCGLDVASFDYTVSDTIDTDTGTVTIDLTCVNDPPVAVDDDASGTEDTLLTITKASLIANDSNGGDGGTLSLTAVSDASGGSVVIDGSDVKFTPTDNLCGLDVASFDLHRVGHDRHRYRHRHDRPHLRQRPAGRGRRRRVEAPRTRCSRSPRRRSSPTTRTAATAARCR